MKYSELITLFQTIDDSLNGAYESNDIDKISRFLSDDWAIIEAQTGIGNKARFLQAIEDGRLSHSTMKKKVVQVKLYNEVALVISRGKNTGQYLGKIFDAEQWVTNIYTKVQSEWICILTQETPVSCE